MVTNGITYGASQLTSDGVSYQKKDGELTTVKQALDELINTSLSKIDELEEKVTDYEKGIHYLADKAVVGDYVIYDVGKWTSSPGLPTIHGTFGGYTLGTSKGKSVETCVKDSINKTTLNGWRVLTVNKATHDVTIIHAGIPECYYHGTNSSESVIKLNAKANDYKTKYAESAHAMNYEEANALDPSNTLRKIIATYWLATPVGDSPYLYRMFPDSSISYLDNSSYGFRPVIVLKSKILTTGKETDEFGQQAWTLVAPTA